MSGLFPLQLSEARGFEPLTRLRGQRFSRPPHSTALPRLLKTYAVSFQDLEPTLRVRGLNLLCQRYFLLARKLLHNPLSFPGASIVTTKLTINQFHRNSIFRIPCRPACIMQSHPLGNIFTNTDVQFSCATFDDVQMPRVLVTAFLELISRFAQNDRSATSPKSCL